jgi:SAM-dependent methyltransferase
MQVDYERGGTQKDEYSAEEVVAVPCPFCGSEDGTTLAVDHGANGIRRCSACTLIYTSPRAPEPEKNYWGDYEKYVTEARLIFTGQAPHHRDPNYIEELELIEAHRPEKGRFLDVGCNMGMLLRLARGRGWEAVGVEPSPALHKIATEQLGLTVHNCYLDGLPDSERGSFDVVALSDVFEHVTDPRGFLQVAARYLKPDGLLFVKVPNARWNVLKQRLPQLLGRTPSPKTWDSYEHVVHYTEPTLRAMLRSEGFEPLFVGVSRPVQVPVWHEYVGQYFQYPSPWVLDWRQHLGRFAFYAISRVEQRLRGGEIGFAAPNLVTLARGPGAGR